MVVRGAAAVSALLAGLVGCAPVELKERPPAAAYRALPKGTLNTGRLSPASRELAERAGLRTGRRDDPGEAIAELERQLAARPDDVRLRLAVCESCLKRARDLEKRSPSSAVGYYLAAAEHSYPAATGRLAAGDAGVLKAIYNHASARTAVILHRDASDWPEAAAFRGPGKTYSLRLDTSSPERLSPASFDELVAADGVEIRGSASRQVQEGAGGALAGYREATEQRRAGSNMSPAGFTMPVNATLEFSPGGRVELALHDLMSSSHARLGGRQVRLAGDFSVPIGRLIENAPVTSGIKGLVVPEQYEAEPGLYLIEPYRPERIPLIFVHGLSSHPSTWMETFNELLGDQEIRERYQFWFVLYSTAEPVVYNAARLRAWLRQMYAARDPQGTNPNLRQTVLVGHSMGGLLASFQIREGGDQIWNQLFTKAIDSEQFPADAREEMRELIYFKPDEHVRRTVFIATPHLGAPMASSIVGRLGSRLVKLPNDIATQRFVRETPETFDLLTDTGKGLLGTPVNSVVALQEYSEGLKVLHELPISPRVTYHAIIGDRGKGDAPDGSDGLVPYYSAHLDGAASEKIVPSGHSAHQHPDGIAELRRILRLHLRECGRL